MRTYILKSLLVLIFALVGLSCNAQYVTTHTKNATPGVQDGIYYALPKTIIKLDFIIEESFLYEGPYADYAPRYLGTNDYIQRDGREYRIVDVVMSTIGDADPDATFFVSYDSKSKNSTSFNLLPNGIIQSVGEPDFAYKGQSVISKTIGNNINESTFQYNIQDNTFSRIDTIVRKITIDTTVIFKNIYHSSVENRSIEQKAKMAATKIDQLREDRIKLLTGYQEIAYPGNTLQYMVSQIESLEQEYISLFVGKRVSRIIEKTIYVVPSKEVTTQTVAKFSETEGLTTGVSGYGSPITVQTISLQNTAKINAPSQSAIEATSHNNKIFYRIPEVASVRVKVDGKTLLEERHTINQLGVLLLTPINNMRLTFDPVTGQLIKVSKMSKE